MSIIINGMEMPKGCIDCPFMFSKDNDYCVLQSDEANSSFESWDDMKASCPLHELQPHGRLIDADALADEMGYGNKPHDCNECVSCFMCEDRGMPVCEWIDSAPTIIEAEAEA